VLKRTAIRAYLFYYSVVAEKDRSEKRLLNFSLNHSKNPQGSTPLRTVAQTLGPIRCSTLGANDWFNGRKIAVMETALMKLLAAVSTTTLFLLLGTTAAPYAPQERQEQGDKTEKQGEKAKPEKKEPQAKPAKQEQTNKPVKQETKQASQEKRDKPATEESKRAQQEQKDEPAKHEARQAKQEQEDEPAKHEAKQAKQEQKDQHVRQQDQQSAQHSQRDDNRGNGGHGRISDEHYRASFGSGHNFHVNRGDYDHRRFNYGGYSFGFIDPWPAAWYYTDDVYVVYDDGGYYMYNAGHPGMRISVNVL
jgi:outer membrane biosynthesis protein TonB